MPDDQPNPDDAAERLEAALERIAAAARQAVVAPTVPPDTAAQDQAAAQLDGLIARLRARLHEFAEDGEKPGLVGAAPNGIDDEGED